MTGITNKRAKSYPNLALPVRHGEVRTLRTALRVTVPTKLVTAHVREQLLDGLDEKIREVELMTGLRCPRGFETNVEFDTAVDMYRTELCDVEQFALRHLIANSLRSYDVVAKVPNHHVLGGVIRQLDSHVLRNGGHDASESYDNLSKLHPESRRIAEYLKQKLPPSKFAKVTRTSFAQSFVKMLTWGKR